MVDEVCSHLGVVPAAEDGGLGAGVVLVHKLSVLLLLELRSLAGAVRFSSGSIKALDDSHDTLRNEPVTHLRLVPRGVSSVLDIPVVVLHLLEELVTGGGLGVNDTVLNEPIVNGGGRPSLVDRAGGLVVGGPYIAKERSSACGSRGADNVVLLEPSSELVIVPSGEDIVFRLVELLRDLGGSVSSLSRNGAGS